MSSTTAFEIDESKHPLIQITLRREASTDEFKAYLTDLDAILARQQRVALLFHTPQFVGSPSDQRLLMSRWPAAHEEPLRRWVYGAGFVVSSQLTVVILRAIFIFSPPAMPYRVTSSLAEGTTWCGAMLSRPSLSARGRGETPPHPGFTRL